MIKDEFPGRVGIQQRVVPTYRAVFLDSLAKLCRGGLSVFAGRPLAKESIDPVVNLQNTRLIQTRNKNFLDPSSSLYMCWQNDFIKWLDHWQPDVLIVEANPRYLSTHQAISFMHKHGRKVVGWGLGAAPIEGLLSNLLRRERISFLRSLDAIIAYSRQGAEQYLQLGIPQNRVYVAINAVDPAPTVPPPERQKSFKGKATVLFAGRLQSRKRVDLLIKACAGLPDEIQPNLVIIGDGPARQEFENLAKQIYPRAKFFGAKYGAELDSYYAQADLFVLPGTGGLAIQQAMARGLPVIVAHGDGTQDDLVRQENGWQVPPDELDALTDILRLALSDPSKLRVMGNASYRIVVEEINVDKMVEVFVRVLKDVSQVGEWR